MSSAGPHSSLTELVRSAGLVFSGEVVDVGTSRVRGVQASPRTAVVRADRGLRVDPALGDVHGRLITIETAGAPLQRGDEAVFFTQSLVHADEVAVREIERMAIDLADDVEAAVAQLPVLHLAERLADAVVVVQATVTHVRRVPHRPPERRAPRWTEATLDVARRVKGRRIAFRFFFPASTSHRWYEVPKPTRGDRAIFLLHRPDAKEAEWLDLDGRDADVLTAPDPADVQPTDALARVRALLGEQGR